jgi:hypothetical protein
MFHRSISKSHSRTISTYNALSIVNENSFLRATFLGPSLALSVTNLYQLATLEYLKNQVFPQGYNYRTTPPPQEILLAGWRVPCFREFLLCYNKRSIVDVVRIDDVLCMVDAQRGDADAVDSS